MQGMSYTPVQNMGSAGAGVAFAPQAAPMYTTAQAATAYAAPSTVYPAQVAPTMSQAVLPMLSAAAPPAFGMQQQQGLFNMMDRNHDGVITRAEFAQAVR